jgi:luciferase-like monooxygenase
MAGFMMCNCDWSPIRNRSLSITEVGDSLILEKISKEILSWPGVTTDLHRFGGTEFRLGKRELGHIHGDKLADMPFPMQIRDQLIESGRASPHHVLPKSGWVSKWIKGEEDITEVVKLFRMQYKRLIGKSLQ